MISDDRLLYDVLVGAFAILVLAWLVVGLARVAASRRPGLHLGRMLAVAALARLVTAGLFASVPALQSIRGPDEVLWLRLANQLAGDAGALGEMPRALVGNLHVAFIAVGELLFDPTSDYPLRVGQIAAALTAIAVVSVAVADLAGSRAGLVTGWILALEPNNVFFSGILHKEALVLLGEAIVILGCVRMAQRRDATAMLIMALGVAIAGMTRPYVGAALAVACLAICMHAALRPLNREHKRSPRLAIAAALAAGIALIAAPSPSSVLSRLQFSQNANSTDASNLRLEPVDYSSVGSTIVNIGPRISEVLLQPYPWQIENTSQRFGVVGTLIAWAVLLVTLVLIATRFRVALSRLPPVLYVVVALAVAYALSTGNAGTGFRYRTHVLVGLVAMAATLACAPRSQPVRYGSDR